MLQLPPPRFHVVARGERFEDIARRYNVDPRSLALLNRMQPPYDVRAGQRIVLPAMARAYEAPSACARARQLRAPPRERRMARFAWPLRGEIVARFGAQPGGARLDGIEIAGREGARMVAPRRRAMSSMPARICRLMALWCLLRHAEDYVTAYGYNRRALVREGQHVRAGEAIAELGRAARRARAAAVSSAPAAAQAIDPAPLAWVIAALSLRPITACGIGAHALIEKAPSDDIVPAFRRRGRAHSSAAAIARRPERGSMFISEAYAQAAGAAARPEHGSSCMQMLPLILIFVVFYFLLIRPQQQARKRHMEMIAALKKGDVVVTSGGLIGKVKSVADDEVRVELAPNVDVRVVRAHHRRSALQDRSRARQRLKAARTEPPCCSLPRWRVILVMS